MDIMNFHDLISKRFSARKYAEQKVEPEKLRALLEAARLAPTACNYQPFKVLVIQSESGMEKLGKASKTYGAPLALVVCADHSACWKRPRDKRSTADIDASIVTDHIMLQAAELGLGTVWVCSFDLEALRREFNVPDELEPVNILIAGYSADDAPNPRHFQRKNIEDFTIEETF
ncbi:MAG: nitroreductase family protein [Prevotellaceae bacterium]|jgi:nitroreductase|nr:nitroreductase family protein [Prevotellaceae bacterium]